MTTSLFRQIFPKKKPVIAMIHVFGDDPERQLEQALADAERLEQGGVDGLLVENYGCGYTDANRATYEMAERLAEITAAVRDRSQIPVGINMLPNDYWKSFLVAACAGGAFIQMDHVTGNFLGPKPVDPENYLRTRKSYPGIAVFGGVHPKYYRLAEPDCPLEDCAGKAAALADAVVVTGQVTGNPPTLEDLRKARQALGAHPLIVGSGLTPENAPEQLAVADGAIVGTAFKRAGVRPGEPVDLELVRRLMDEVARLR